MNNECYRFCSIDIHILFKNKYIFIVHSDQLNTIASSVCRLVELVDLFEAVRWAFVQAMLGAGPTTRGSSKGAYAAVESLVAVEGLCGSSKR